MKSQCSFLLKGCKRSRIPSSFCSNFLLAHWATCDRGARKKIQQTSNYKWGFILLELYCFWLLSPELMVWISKWVLVWLVSGLPVEVCEAFATTWRSTVALVNRSLGSVLDRGIFDVARTIKAFAHRDAEPFAQGRSCAAFLEEQCGINVQDQATFDVVVFLAFARLYAFNKMRRTAKTDGNQFCPFSTYKDGLNEG